MYIATQLLNEHPEHIRTETILPHFQKAIDSVFLLELWVLLYVPLFILVFISLLYSWVEHLFVL